MCRSIYLLLVCAFCTLAAGDKGSGGGGIIKDLRFDIPPQMQSKRGLHIRILLENKELFRGDLAAVKTGDFNFTVPDSVMHNGENKLIVEFFLPPSELTLAQSILTVDMELEDSKVPHLTPKRVAAAVGASAILGLALRQSMREAPSQSKPPLPPAAQTSGPPDPVIAPQPEVDKVRDEPEVGRGGNQPSLREFSPPVRPTQLLRPGCNQFLQRDVMMKQLDCIRNNKMASVAVGAVILSRFSSSILKFGQKEKVKSSPVSTIAGRSFGKARRVLQSTWNAVRRILDLPEQ